MIGSASARIANRAPVATLPCVRLVTRKKNPREIALELRCELPKSAKFSIEKSEQFSVEIDNLSRH